MSSAGSPPQVASQRAAAPDLGHETETADLAIAPRHFQFEAAQRLAIMAEHRAELHVEVDIGRWSFRRRLDGRGQGLEQTATVISVAAHDRAQRAVRQAIDLETGAIAIGEAVGREVRGQHIARIVEVDDALHPAAGALDPEILNPDRLGFGQ